jgi:hypothetical protein
MSRFYIVLGVVLLALPLSFAFDCSIVDADLCTEIEASDWSDEEKMAAYTALTYKEFPNYDGILEHNQAIEITEIPSEADVGSASYIEYAWVDILSLEPTVLINGTLHSPGEGELLAAYDYKINAPSGTQPGDCKTEYSVGTSESYQTYLNGEEANEFSFTEDSVIEAELKVSVSVTTTHYTMQVVRNRWRCAYDYSESSSGSVSVSDSIDVVYYNPEIESEIKITEEAYGSYDGNFTISNATGFDIEFSDSSVSHRDWHYYYSISSVDVITVVAEENTWRDSENINLDDDNFVVSSIEDCLITLYTHFNEETKDCDLTYEYTDSNITMEYEPSEEWETFSDLGIFGGVMYVLGNVVTVMWRRFTL